MVTLTIARQTVREALTLAGRTLTPEGQRLKIGTEPPRSARAEP